MSELVIKVEQLQKSYFIGHQRKGGSGYSTLRESLANNLRGLSRKTHDILVGRSIIEGDIVEEFFALNDISFEVRQGDRVGIIGRNGAGKSTLLKILSRITEPTAGKILIRGRVASLLEVGTGFHPELTGRENIFLNGAILGMSRREISRKFDQIVDFAEVEKFLDTPVKRYSSGMYVRLAFAVAAYLEPEILVVDEVLAVGDSRFQKKCMGRMDEVSKEGRTILFVSHNMGAVSELCNRAILLEDGRVVSNDLTSAVLTKYLQSGNQAEYSLEPLLSCHPVFVTKMHLLDLQGNRTSRLPLGEDAVLEISFVINQADSNISIAVLLSHNGFSLLYSHDNDLDPKLMDERREPGEYIARLRLPLSRMKEGSYCAAVHIGVGPKNMTLPEVTINFEVENYEVNTHNKGYRADRPGHLYWPLPWEIGRK